MIHFNNGKYSKQRHAAKELTLEERTKAVETIAKYMVNATPEELELIQDLIYNHEIMKYRMVVNGIDYETGNENSIGCSYGKEKLKDEAENLVLLFHKDLRGKKINKEEFKKLREEGKIVKL